MASKYNYYEICILKIVLLLNLFYHNIMSESSYYLIIYFYYKSNKIYIIFDSIEEFREHQQAYLIKFHQSVLTESLEYMKNPKN